MRRKKYRKAVKLILCFLLLGILLSACGGNQETSSQKYSMTISFVGKPKMAIDKSTPTEQYLEDKFQVNLDVISISTNYMDKLTAMLASGDIPDVMFVNDASYWKSFASQNIIAPLELETIAKYAPKHYEYINQYEEKMWKLGEYKGQLYAIPKTMGNEYNTVMAWRKDWLDNVGIAKVPDTLEECEEAFVRFRHNDPDGNGEKDTYGLTGLGGSSWRQFDVYFGAYGIMPGQWMVEDGHIFDPTVSDEAKEVLSLLHRWYEMELIDPELITDTVETVGKKFDLGRIGVMNTGIGNISENSPHGKENIELFKKSNPDSPREIVYGKLPAGPNGDRGDYLWGPLSNFVVFGIGVQDDLPKQQKILTMLDEINYDPETALRVIYGEKGKTYAYNDEEIGAKSGLRFLPPYDVDANARAKEGIGLGGFFNLFSPEGGDWADSYIVQQYTSDAYIQENEQFASIGNYRDALMRVTLPSDARYRANLEKIKSTNYSAFITGQRSLDEWDAFVEEYMDNGGSVLLQEAEEYYVQNLKE